VRHRKRNRDRRRPVDLDLSSPPVDLSKMNAPVIYVRRIPRDPEHEAEVTAALAVMKARKENGP
jgi:hypothetical protein